MHMFNNLQLSKLYWSQPPGANTKDFASAIFIILGLHILRHSILEIHCNRPIQIQQKEMLNQSFYTICPKPEQCIHTTLVALP